MVINKKNYKFFSEFIAFYFRNFGIKDFRFNFIKPQGRALKNFKILVPRYKEVFPYLSRAISIFKDLSINISVSDFPFCTLKKIKNFQNYIGEFKDEKKIRKGKILDRGKRVEFYISERENRLRIKPKSCEKCIYNFFCPGIFKKYANNYGMLEFKPIKSK